MQKSKHKLSNCIENISNYAIIRQNTIGGDTMGFCTKCGQPIIDGQVHVCPAAATQPVTQQPTEKSFAVQQKGDSINISIDTEKMKDKVDTAKEKLGLDTDRKDSTGAYERGKKIVPECICANDGEIPVKQYNIAKLRTRLTLAKAEGRLQVTNKRLIFRATGRSIMGRVSLHEEFKINEIAGVEFRNRPEFNFLNLLGAMLLTSLFGAIGGAASYWIYEESDEAIMYIASVFALVFAIASLAGCVLLAILCSRDKTTDKMYALRQMVLSISAASMGAYGVNIVDSDSEVFGGILLFFAALTSIGGLINLFLMAFVPNLAIIIKTKGALPGIQVQKETPIGLFSMLFGNSAPVNSGFAEVLPWKDTDTAMRELGTIVDDIQTIGDTAISKWAE